MKKLYEFTFNKKEIVNKETPDKDGDKDIIRIEKVEKKTPFKFFLKKPNRILWEEAELFYAVELSKATKAGILTSSQLASKFSDEVETYSRKEREKYIENYTLLIDKEKELGLANSKVVGENADANKEAVEKIQREIIQIQRDVLDFERKQSSLYEHTADTIASGKLCVWWTAQLFYYDGEKPVFGDGSYEEKMAVYDKIEESGDEFLMESIKKVSYLVAFWKANSPTKDQFDAYMRLAGFVENEQPQDEVSSN